MVVKRGTEDSFTILCLVIWDAVNSRTATQWYNLIRPFSGCTKRGAKRKCVGIGKGESRCKCNGELSKTWVVACIKSQRLGDLCSFGRFEALGGGNKYKLDELTVMVGKQVLTFNSKLLIGNVIIFPGAQPKRGDKYGGYSLRTNSR